ncbi:Integrase family protein [Yersinia pekkanenii]|uniref:Integrase family protein n=1 Tax=Yersinia pekkanenii TaxID=1288385 RepID=A0A0T9RJQ2_9GAMM|nr:Integrase family protein [Yersinia pekkanenii]CRY69553.1 Integrase family protein [Yersinia pekkanenii]
MNECSEPLKSIVVFALATGLRRSNIVDFQWQDVDLQRKVTWIHPKESKSGQAIGVALNDTACRLLRGQIGNHKKRVFVHRKESTLPNGSKSAAVRKMRVDGNTAWRLALKRAGIDNFRFHDLRHTWASWLVQAGVPLTVLQETGGWESIEMVQRYAYLAPRHLSAHAKQINSIFDGNVPNSSLQEQN